MEFRSFFLPSGRISRAQYLVNNLIIVVVFNLLFWPVTLAIMILLGDLGPVVGPLWVLLLGMVAVVLVAFQTVKRLHDLGHGGINWLLTIIPVYNLYMAYLLLFEKGNFGPNEYGEDPLHTPAADGGPPRIEP